MTGLGPLWRLSRGDRFFDSHPFWPAVFRIGLSKLRRRPVWDGVWLRRQDVPAAESDGFDADAWLVPLYLSAKKTKLDLENGRPVEPRWAHTALFDLVAGLASEISVLDAGGGMGGAYLYLLSRGIPREKLRYQVLEKEAVAAPARGLLAGYPGISFPRSFSEARGPVDVVYVSTALQYFEDLAPFYDAIRRLAPRFVLLRRLSAGDVPTFWTLQKNVPGTATPYRFFRFSELAAPLEENYRLAYRRESPNPYPMTNLPGAYRLPAFCDALFERKSDAPSKI